MISMMMMLNLNIDYALCRIMIIMMMVTVMIMMTIKIFDRAGHVQSRLGVASFSVEGTLTLAVKVKIQCFR